MKVHISIDRLVLDGLSPGPRDRELLRRSFEKELARLIGGQRSHIRGQSAAKVAAPPVRVNRQKAGQMGESIARSVFHGMRGD
jgi:hypothetical protein